jgi:NSS family neurotransmitter:Na+ symporter
MAVVWNDFALPIGGLLIALFVGYAWPSDGAIEELRAEGAWVPLPRVWKALVRYVCPVAIFLIIVLTFRSLAGY